MSEDDDDATNWFLRVRNNDVKTMTGMIESGIVDINQKEPQSCLTALQIASELGQSEMVRLLLQNKAHNVKDKWGANGMMVAAKNGHVDVVDEFLEFKMSPDTSDKHHWTVLMEACKHGHFVVAQTLISHGADVNLRKPNLWSPLNSAVEQGHIKIAELLLDNGAEINATMKSGFTPLMIASRDGLADMVELLIRRGADLTMLSGPCNSSLDHCIASALSGIKPIRIQEVHNDFVAVANMLLTFGCPQNVKTSSVEAWMNENQVQFQGWSPDIHWGFAEEFKRRAMQVMLMWNHDQYEEGECEGIRWNEMPLEVVLRIIEWMAFQTVIN